MTKKQFVTFSAALKTYYPKESLLPNEQALDLWYNQLKDIPYEVATIVLNAWVAMNKWSPTIADIRENAAKMISGEVPDWDEGWEAVLGAIRRFGRYREAEALESMDEVTRMTVKRLGYGNLCASENLSVDRASFRSVYETLKARKIKEKQLQPELLGAIQMWTGKALLEEKEVDKA